MNLTIFWSYFMIKKIASWLSIGLTVALVSACGGGGGGGGSTPPPPVVSTETFQLRTAYANYFNETKSLPFTLTGTVQEVAVTGSGTYTLGNVTNANFEGGVVLAKTSTVAGSFSGGGRTFPLNVTELTYADSNYNPLGFSDSDEYEVITNQTPIPPTVKVNDSGVWYSSDLYSDSSKTQKTGTKTVTYVLQPDTATTALLRLIATEKDNNGARTVNTTTFRITPSGTITLLTQTALDGTSNLTVNY